MYKPLIVLHESISTSNELIATLQNINSPVTYHVLISRNGSVTYLVDSREKASAGYLCSFNGEQIDNSVDDFAYHIVLESPPDSDIPKGIHEGYTVAQYYSLAYLIAKTGVPNSRIVTHAEIDVTKSRLDPYNFDKDLFFNLLAKFPKSKEIHFGIDGE